MGSLRISQLAERSGVPATTLRFYDSAGLLPAQRSKSGYRVYGEQAVERLRFIRAAKHVGLQLDAIRELLSVWEHDTCSGVRARLQLMIRARIADAERRAAELEVFSSSLRASLAHLDTLPDRATHCDTTCAFLELRGSTRDGAGVAP